MTANGTKDFLGGAVPVKGNVKPNGEAPKVQEFTAPPGSAQEKELIESDVIVIGAGFSGITAIDRFRRRGMSIKCFESGEDFGGVWYWNRYPGARVDSEAPFYQLNIPEVVKTWTFTERFPDHRELRRYMAHIDKTLNLRKDTYFNARVNDCSWDEKSKTWTIKTLQGHTAKARYLVLATGLLHQTYTPDFPGLKEYKGEVYHTGAWPEDWSAKGKKVGLIGAGATAVQVTQEVGKEADELTVFLRRPSYCLAMNQRTMTDAEQNQLKPFMEALFKAGRKSRAGFPNGPENIGAKDVPIEERERRFDEAWSQGGFQFQLATYNDIAVDKESNKIAYDYWRKRVCERLTDPEKQKIMAPEKAPYYFGTKRNPLEQDYYEVLNQSNVRIHDLSAAPLETFTPTGLRMADSSVHDFDVIILATGFDSFSGSVTRMGLKNADGVDLKDLWQDGIKTYLGLTMNGFPNCFMAYSPQAPTALSNGPTIIETQVENIVDMIVKLEKEGAKTIEPTRDAEEQWAQQLDSMMEYTLFPFTDSWWNGSNIPGKKKQNMSYIGGIENYEKEIKGAIDGWKGFAVAV